MSAKKVGRRGCCLQQDRVAREASLRQGLSKDPQEVVSEPCVCLREEHPRQQGHQRMLRWECGRHFQRIASGLGELEWKSKGKNSSV